MNPAFAYLYDDFLSERRYERELNAIEAELARRNIGGRVFRLGMFRTPKGLMGDVVRGGAKNVVIVGNDLTLGKLLWDAPELEVTVGYLPIGSPSRIADMLGIPSGEKAAEVLAARFIETLDVGRIGDRRFLTEIVVRDPGALLVIDGKFSIKPVDQGSIIVRNIGMPGEDGKPTANAKDGKLEAVVTREIPAKYPWQKKHETSEQTVLAFERGRIEAFEQIDMVVDGITVTGRAFDLWVDPKPLQFITGRRRRLSFG